MVKKISDNILQKRLFTKFTKQELQEIEKNLLKFLDKNFNRQEKIIKEIIITDLDDTIFSLDKRFEEYPILKEKIWEEWNKYIFENIWIENFIKKIYKNKKFPKNISSKLKKNCDLILTAWNENFQKAKLKELWLDNINYKIVKSWKDKILTMLKYFLEDLKSIPEKIIIYEDRPEFFIYFRDFIEKNLKTIVEINYVEMNWNEKEPKIIKL